MFLLSSYWWTEERKKENLQAVQVHPSLHLSQGPQVVQVRCSQMVFLRAPVVPGGREALEAPDETRRYTKKIFLESTFHMPRATLSQRWQKEKAWKRNWDCYVMLNMSQKENTKFTYPDNLCITVKVFKSWPLLMKTHHMTSQLVTVTVTGFRLEPKGFTPKCFIFLSGVILQLRIHNYTPLEDKCCSHKKK